MNSDVRDNNTMYTQLNCTANRLY